MKNSTNGSTLRIPVRFVDGKMEYEFGGPVPLREGTQAELVLGANSITDEAFLRAMELPGQHRVLPEGAKLLIGLNVMDRKIFAGFESVFRNIADMIGKIVFAAGDVASSSLTSLVEIALSKPTEKQQRLYGSEDGGLWLSTKGIRATGLLSSTIKLPDGISEEPATSLNHALTILSEKFEPWRISHTGNVYQQVFYQEGNGKWYALDYLRNEKLAKAEMQIANHLWSKFLAEMTW